MLIRRMVVSAIFVALPVAALTAADLTDSGPIAWKKIIVDKVFRSEGAAVADVNRDGKLDILVGDFWYEAPEWKLHPIRRMNVRYLATVDGRN